VPNALPLDAHLHTDLSPDADVPIDVYAALAREQGVAELAITDHVDFDPDDPAYDFSDFERRERSVREAADRWVGEPEIRFGAELTYERRLEPLIREHLAHHTYDYVIGSVHITRRSPLRSPASAAAWCQGKTHREAVEWYFDEVEAAARSGLFDTIGHLDFVKRYVVDFLGPLEFEPHADLYDRVLRALIESGTALEVNSSGLRQATGETYPAPVVVERYHQLGGRRITAGSDAHRAAHFGFGLDDAYRSIHRAGFNALSFRRGGDRVAVDFAHAAVFADAGTTDLAGAEPVAGGIRG